MKTTKGSYEFIIVGSGFGGAFAALNLSKKGKEVLVIERGTKVARDDSCWDEMKLHIKDHLYRGKTPFLVDQKKGEIKESWPDDTLGGMSTLYGAASFRMREDDFNGAPLPDSDKRDPDSAWPYSYNELSPYYDIAEDLLGLSGQKNGDITEPPGKKDYPQPHYEKLSRPSKKIWDAAESLNMHPFHLPMAINFSGNHGKGKCILCHTCDHYLCKVEAKNDLDVTVLTEAVNHGTEILENCRVLKLNHKNKKVFSVSLIDQKTSEKKEIKCKNIIIDKIPAITNPAPGVLFNMFLSLDNIIFVYIA